MKLKVNGKHFNVLFTFLPEGSLLPWQAEAYVLPALSHHEFDIPDIVVSGTTPDTALQALALELSEVY